MGKREVNDWFDDEREAVTKERNEDYMQMFRRVAQED
jgi:hypothetical protein